MLVLQAPANYFGGRSGSRAQQALMSAKDGRVRMVGEALLGMKAIKLMAWEEHFQVDFLNVL